MIATLLAATWLALACGGGTDSVGTGGTGSTLSFATGRISGFGSVIVNGVHFDDSTATVTDDAGLTHARGDLKLGMVVDIHGGPLSTDATSGVSNCAAAGIQFGSEIKGAVQTVNVAAGRLTLVGQTVNVDASTVFEGYGNGLAEVMPGDLLEVFAFFDAARNSFQATRIERENALTEFKVGGVVTGLATAAKTFVLAGASVSYASVAAADLPALSNGLRVRVTVLPAPQAGIWIATKVRTAVHRIEDRAEAHVEGVISDFASLASFKVNNVAVDASGAGVVFHDGSSAQVLNGVRIEVEGMMQGAVLLARKVELKQSGHGGHDAEVELHGVIESIDASAGTFVVRGVEVSHDGSTIFVGGTAGNLGIGAKVEVKGTLATTGNSVAAASVVFEH